MFTDIDHSKDLFDCFHPYLYVHVIHLHCLNYFTCQSSVKVTHICVALLCVKLHLFLLPHLKSQFSVQNHLVCTRLKLRFNFHSSTDEFENSLQLSNCLNP